MARVGYTRVSTEAQNLDRQLDGIDLDKVFADKVSGKTTRRPKLDELLDYVRDGDTVVVHSMDRLAPNSTTYANSSAASPAAASESSSSKRT